MNPQRTEAQVEDASEIAFNIMTKIELAHALTHHEKIVTPYYAATLIGARSGRLDALSEQAHPDKGELLTELSTIAALCTRAAIELKLLPQTSAHDAAKSPSKNPKNGGLHK